MADQSANMTVSGEGRGSIARDVQDSRKVFTKSAMSSKRAPLTALEPNMVKRNRVEQHKNKNKQRSPPHPRVAALQTVASDHAKTATQIAITSVDNVLAELLDLLEDDVSMEVGGVSTNAPEYMTTLSARLVAITSGLDGHCPATTSDTRLIDGTEPTLQATVSSFERIADKARRDLEQLAQEYTRVNQDIETLYQEIRDSVRGTVDTQPRPSSTLQTILDGEVETLKSEVEVLVSNSIRAVETQEKEEAAKSKTLREKMDRIFMDLV